MRIVSVVAAATALVVPMVVSAPSQAVTAYQQWAQGRGAFVTSKDRGWTYQDDLRAFGWDAPPPPPGYYPPPPPPGYYDDGPDY